MHLSWPQHTIRAQLTRFAGNTGDVLTVRAPRGSIGSRVTRTRGSHLGHRIVRRSRPCRAPHRHHRDNESAHYQPHHGTPPWSDGFSGSVAKATAVPVRLTWLPMGLPASRVAPSVDCRPNDGACRARHVDRRAVHGALFAALRGVDAKT